MTAVFMVCIIHRPILPFALVCINIIEVGVLPKYKGRPSMETAVYVLVTRFEVEKRSIFPLRSILGNKKATKQSKRNTGPSHSKQTSLQSLHSPQACSASLHSSRPEMSVLRFGSNQNSKFGCAKTQACLSVRLPYIVRQDGSHYWKILSMTIPQRPRSIMAYLSNDPEHHGLATHPADFSHL